MVKHIARYSVTFGLAGCYMPDSVNGPYLVSTRRELADIIRSKLELSDLPASLFRKFKIRRLWGFIRRNGSSVAHFSLNHGNYELGFHGLTQNEFNQMDGEI